MAHAKFYLFIFSFLFMGTNFNLLAEPIPGIEGSGSNNSPHHINSAYSTTPLQKLNKIAKWVNKDTSGPDGWDGVWICADDHFILEADISGFTGTIGTDDSPFMGTFDGNSHRIDVNINKSGSYSVGLFGRAENAIIKNLTVSGTVIGKNYVGGVLGRGQNVWIEHCTNVANVTAVDGLYGNNIISFLEPFEPGNMNPDSPTALDNPLINGGYYAGGIIGGSDTNGVDIVMCANAGRIVGANSIGGIIGGGLRNTTEIIQCINIGTIKGNYKSYSIGGIAGRGANNIENSLNGGFVTGDAYVGGIIGHTGPVNDCAVVKYCLNTGVIYGKQFVGSVAGYMSNTTNAMNNFYDKQMSSKGGINGNDIANRAVGKTTFELTGNNLSAWSTFWKMNTSYIRNLYPTPRDVGNIHYITNTYDYDNQHLEHTAAATLELQASPVFETTDNVQTKVFFTHTWANVYWTAKLEHVHILGFSDSTYSEKDNAPWDARGAIRGDTMVANCYKYSKQVPIYIPVAIYKTAAEVNYANAFSISEVTPNIVTDNATIAIQTATEGNLNVSIYDLAGTKVADVADRYIDANTSLQVDLNNLSNLSTGSYMAVVSIGNEVIMRKFIKQ